MWLLGEVAEEMACERMSFADLRVKVASVPLGRARASEATVEGDADAPTAGPWLVAVAMVVAVMAGEVYQLPRELVLLGRRAYHKGDLGVRASAVMGCGAAAAACGANADDDGDVDLLELLRSITELAVLTEGGSWKS